MDLSQRVRTILLKPREAWPEIRDEGSTLPDLFVSYAAPLAAVPALAGFIGTSVVGIPLLASRYRAPLLEGLGSAVVYYMLALAAVALIAIIIYLLAPYFGSQKDFSRALRLTVFSATPWWMSGALLVIPSLSPLATLLSLYGLYLLYVGLPALMGTPRAKALPYVVLIAVAGVIASVLVSSLTTLIFPAGRAGLL